MPQNPMTSDRELCECQPEREHDDYARPAEYMHEGTCPVAERQMAAVAVTPGGRHE